MELHEFSDKVNELFKGRITDLPFYRIYITDKLLLSINISPFVNIGYDHYLLIYNNLNDDHEVASVLYRSGMIDNLEQMYDELIIFKELILPKYL